MKSETQLLTVYELADVLRVSYKTALKVMKRSLPYVQVAGQYRIRAVDVEKYLCNIPMDTVKKTTKKRGA